MVIHTNFKIISASVCGMVVVGILFKSLNIIEQGAVIGHEMGHIRNNHSMMRLWWAIIGVWIWDHEWLMMQLREQEFEADRYAARLGYASGMISLLRKFDAPQTKLHPSAQERIERIQELQYGK